jgi:ferric enterobactin receptor
MKCKFVLVLALTLVAGAVSLPAQTPARTAPGTQAPPTANGEVRGTVVEGESGAAVLSASVAVRSARDSSLVTGAFVREDGSFRIVGLFPGRYYVRVSAIGFAPRNSDVFAISPTEATANLGALRMTRTTVMLDNVEVVAERPTVVIEPDRNSYRARDVAPAASSASDVLQATPSVEVDADGKVSLRGNENVAVQINGRPAPIRGAQLGAYLRQLPASVIERVEVVPTPSARHDPEGMAGIINIVLRQNTDLGLSGGFTLGASPSNRYNVSGNLGYQVGDLTLFGTYGFNADERPVTGINDRERYDAFGAILSATDQDLSGENSFAGHNFNISADYRLSQRDVLSNALAFNIRSSADASLAAVTERDATLAPVSRYDQVRDSDNRGNMIDYTLALKRTYEARRHELSTELRFNRAKDDDQTNFWRQDPASPGLSGYQFERNATDALTQSLTGQVDYMRPLGARSKIESGYRGNARWLDRDYLALRDDLGSGSWVVSNLTNAFELDEQVHAVYGVVSQGVGRFELQGGLRGEYATRTFTMTEPAESYPYHYTSLFPSGVASYRLNEASQLKLSYSRRIRRPGTQELNPFPNFFDANNVFLGNPELNPEYTDAFELGFNRSTRMATLQVTPFYRRTSNVIRFIIDTDAEFDGRPVTKVTFQNLASGNSWGTDLNGSLRLGPKLSGFAGFNIFKMVTEGGSESSLSSDAVTWSARVNATSQITSTLTLQGMYFYRAPMKMESGSFSAQQMANFTARYRLNGTSTLALRVTDPFNTMGLRVQAGDDNLLQITERKFGVRAVHLTYQYAFGQTPRVRQPRPEPQEPQGGGFPVGG